MASGFAIQNDHAGRPEPADPGPDPLAGIVGRGAAMQRLLARVARVARSEAPVLLRGESGVGKEVMADLLHRLSSRRARPMLRINCAALPESLLESELFGHTRGSFTGANCDREGLFQAADGGILFLDEIGEISPAFQPKLLRVLESGEFHRIGDARGTVRVDVRVIAATNRDLEQAVREGRFRADLYYRLDVVPLSIPPLRARREDVPALLDHFLALHAAGRPLRFAPAARERLEAHDWPGNVRELSNAVQHGVVLAEGEEIGLDDLPDALRGDAGAPSPLAPPADRPEAGTLEAIEMRTIQQAMRATSNNRTRAARLLGVTRRTLGYRLRKYGLDEVFGGGDDGFVDEAADEATLPFGPPPDQAPRA